MSANSIPLGDTAGGRSAGRAWEELELCRYSDKEETRQQETEKQNTLTEENYESDK